ncbi:T9SS type B sorting domain-containing protein [Algibacter sp. AS12]|uniref:T9SS type B sorting domain-containing protein n=1 Tax=Algibacter sp. AS12 TaxID=3135773 RepID=UPI00398B701D
MPKQTSVILKMLNNGVGGCGNDLALDDIVFKSCGDNITVTDTQNNSRVFQCAGSPSSTKTLTANPDFTIFSSHFYQWQESTNNINWTDLIGENNPTFTTPPLNTTIFYRVKVAEDAINISNSFCNALSDTFEFKVVEIPNTPTSNGDLSVCEGSTTPISASTPSGTTVNWYDAATGGNLLLPNSSSYSPQTSGTYYAEAETINGGCVSASRTPIVINFLETPLVEDEFLSFCENTTITLQANSNIPTSTYLWSNGATTEEITVSSPGVYTVAVSNFNCTVTKTITVTQIENPVIDSIASDGRDIVVTTNNEGDFLYSLNGNIYQPNNTFINIEGGQYTIYVKQRFCDTIITKPHLHFYIPKFFTPNNDGVNDEFDLKGIEFYSSSHVSIFNRYGKLIKSASNTKFSWNGSANNINMPSDDYWYIIIIDNQKFSGHFTLKR